jgi:hypothetical protein
VGILIPDSPRIFRLRAGSDSAGHLAAATKFAPGRQIARGLSGDRPACAARAAWFLVRDLGDRAQRPIFATASYRGVEYVDSINFCGTTCPTVTSPEYTAYQNSPHAHVTCIDCHIGPGAPWFVRSKLSGLRQVLAVTFHAYSRPIPSPVKYLRPPRETCEQCHWPQRFTGDKFLVKTSYKDDESYSFCRGSPRHKRR